MKQIVVFLVGNGFAIESEDEKYYILSNRRCKITIRKDINDTDFIYCVSRPSPGEDEGVTLNIYSYDANIYWLIGVLVYDNLIDTPINRVFGDNTSIGNVKNAF